MSGNVMPKITVVTVCYNAVDAIEKTILSVINQTYQNIEYIIIDGGSTDGTLDIIKKYEDRLSKWISEPDKGIYDAMNKGIKMASGDWINFMNAGDVFFDLDVMVRVSRMELNNAAVIFGDFAMKINDVLYQIKAKPFYENMPLHHSMGFNHQSTFVRTDLAKHYPFDLSYKLASDYNMIINLYREGYMFHQLNNLIIAIYDAGGISEKNRFQHIFETLMVDLPNRRLINKMLAIYYFLKLKYKTYVGKCIFKLFPKYMAKRRAQRGVINLSE